MQSFIIFAVTICAIFLNLIRIHCMWCYDNFIMIKFIVAFMVYWFQSSCLLNIRTNYFDRCPAPQMTYASPLFHIYQKNHMWSRDKTNVLESTCSNFYAWYWFLFCYFLYFWNRVWLFSINLKDTKSKTKSLSEC